MSPQAALVEAVRDANLQIHNRGQASEDFLGMGTTLSALAILPEGAMVAQVGDSRVYRLRGNWLEQLSFDHSLLWEFRAAAGPPAQEFSNFIPKNIITRSLGPSPELQVDLEGPFPVEPGDTFLLCSDGLSGPVKDEEIGKILLCLPPQQAVRCLVDLANLNGGSDNITVVVVRVTGPQTARGQSAEQSRPAERSSRILHGALWGLAVLCGAASLGWLAIGEMPLALLGLAGAAVAAGAAVSGSLHKRSTPAPARAESEGQRIGRGPYARFDCTPDEPFVRRLAEIAQQLRDAASNEAWDVDWQSFNKHTSLAAEAAEAADYAEAVREYCRAFGFMMEHYCSERGRKRPGNNARGVP